MKFYKENGINPLGGCLPLVAQLPVFWSLFNVLQAIADWKPGHTPQYGLTVATVESASMRTSSACCCRTSSCVRPPASRGPSAR